MTARALARALAFYGLTVTADGTGVGCTAPPPAGLGAAARVLSTGLLAVLTARRWFGCRRATGAVEVLSPDGRVPSGVTLLAVEGGRVWDRIPAAARTDLSHLFSTPPPTRRPPPRRPDHPRPDLTTAGRADPRPAGFPW